MFLKELMESKWWDDTDVIRLYHGTSSGLLDVIKQEGLRPPSKQLDDWALEILEQYIPRAEWDEDLVNKVRERCGRSLGGRGGDSGQVIFCMTGMEGPAGYARSHAKHGGEVARDVYETACMHVLGKTHDLDELTYREYIKLERPFPPRLMNGHPIVIEMLVPKAWCLFYNDLERMKNGINRAREEGREWAQGDIGDVYDEIFENREVRVAQTVPLSMFVKIHAVAAKD